MFRIGYGYDIHRMKEGEYIVLGGEKIPCDRAMIAHSDGDVLLHAIMDALLGASALGDIGDFFPDTDERYKGISSIELLKKVKLLLDNSGFIINNIDSSVLAEYPKLFQLKKKLAQNIAEILNISSDAVCVKASTQENLGETKNKAAIIAHAVCIIEKKEVKE